MKRGKSLTRRTPLRAKGTRTQKSGGHLLIVPCSVCGRQLERKRSELTRYRPVCNRWCEGNLLRRDHSGAKSACWRGGRYVEPGKGYVMVHRPAHHRARANGYVLEHIVVMEQMVGRALRDGEVVHHINHNRADNRPVNLQLFASNSEHKRIGHPRERASCSRCGKSAHARGLCGTHYAALRRESQ